MFGNVSEWILACLHEEPERVAIDGAPDSVDSCPEGHLALGDNWETDAHPQTAIFPDSHVSLWEDYATTSIGIRIVRHLTDSEAHR